VAAELVVIAVLYLLYRSVRLLTRDSTEQALVNAQRVLDLERAVGLALEEGVQRAALSSELVIELLNRYYVGVHFPATVAFLAWAFVRRRSAYGVIRTWFAVVTFAALVVHVLFPLAPPRMLPGFVDTLQTYGPRIYSEDPAGSVANQFAAMPSLHFGWALMVAGGVLWLRPRRSSLVAVLHPALTLLAIIATGNHYWLDAAVAGVIVVLGAAAVARIRRRCPVVPVAPAAEVPLGPPPARRTCQGRAAAAPCRRTGTERHDRRRATHDRAHDAAADRRTSDQDTPGRR